MSALTFPFNVTVSCDPNPSTEGVVSYSFSMNGGAPVVASVPSAVFSIPSAATYTFSVFATNQWGDGPVASVSASITSPTGPKNIKIVKN